MSFHRKTNRLDAGLYTAPHAYSLTLCTKKRKEYFLNPELVQFCLQHIRAVVAPSFQVYAYCFMPDHLHLLLSPKSETTDLIKTIAAFKQRTAFQAKIQRGILLWQKSFYDHIVRRDEGLDAVTKYILNNPVRAGLVEDFKDYPFLGSFVYDARNLPEVMAGS